MIAGGSGESFSFTFEEPGTCDYFCIPHEQVGMVGTVTVAGGDDAAQDDGGAGQVPDTSGPSLLVPLAAALLACGLVGLTVLRRRIS